MNMFTKYYSGVEPPTEEIFLGWSLSSVADNNAGFKHFDNAQSVSKAVFEQKRDEVGRDEVEREKWFDDIVRGTQVHLYAVWQTYRFSSDDTILRMDANGEEFRIDNYAITPTGGLNNLVLVNFQDK